MKVNIGTTDKAMRISIGLILIMVTIIISMGTMFKIIVMAMGLLALLSSIFGFCFLYRLIGLNTCKMKANR